MPAEEEEDDDEFRSGFRPSKNNKEFLVKLGREAIPERVQQPEGPEFEDVMVLEASSKLELGTAYEPFSPMVF